MSKRLKILSSDDDEGIRAFLFSLLADQGHEIEFARNSDDVFKRLLRAKYDLLILDVNTPGMNGYQVAEKISNELPERPRMLIFTGRDTKAEELQFIACGADSVIRKGAPTEDILRAIDALFDGCQEKARPIPLPPPEPVSPPKEETQPSLEPRGNRLNEDLQYCISKVEQVETALREKKSRYEELIRELSREKQLHQKSDAEILSLREEVSRFKRLVLASCATAGAALLGAIIQI